MSNEFFDALSDEIAKATFRDHRGDVDAAVDAVYQKAKTLRGYRGCQKQLVREALRYRIYDAHEAFNERLLKTLGTPEMDTAGEEGEADEMSPYDFFIQTR